MQDGYYVINFHEHPGDFAARNNARMGIDMAVLLSVGAEKVLYGSEGLWPQAVLHTHLTECEKGLILGGNAIRLLGIKKPTAC